MFEKVNKYHPDKVADRIAGAIVDLAYKARNSTAESNIKYDPRIAVEVLIGHGLATIIIESDVVFRETNIKDIVSRKAGEMDVKVIQVEQDTHLADNQKGKIRCGDNGIFKGTPVTDEQKYLCSVSRFFEDKYKSDGKYIICNDVLTICQSRLTDNEKEEILKNANNSIFRTDKYLKINPLGEWTGGTNVDTGATNRKLGSDMGDGVTGGGLHGKDCSKADVSVNIFAYLLANRTGKTQEFVCSIGDEEVVSITDGTIIPYEGIVKTAKNYIFAVGGFEKFAEYGLLRGLNEE